LYLILFACLHELNVVAFPDDAVFQSEEASDSSELVEPRVEEESLERSLRVSWGSIQEGKC
jgi:hypothetical protein